MTLEKNTKTPPQNKIPHRLIAYGRFPLNSGGVLGLLAALPLSEGAIRGEIQASRASADS